LSFFRIYYRADYPKLRHCCKTFGCFDSSRRFSQKQRLIATNCSGCYSEMV